MRSVGRNRGAEAPDGATWQLVLVQPAEIAREQGHDSGRAVTVAPEKIGDRFASTWQNKNFPATRERSRVDAEPVPHQRSDGDTWKSPGSP